jgi:hypothetical protein
MGKNAQRRNHAEAYRRAEVRARMAMQFTQQQVASEVKDDKTSPEVRRVREQQVLAEQVARFKTRPPHVRRRRQKVPAP